MADEAAQLLPGGNVPELNGIVLSLLPRKVEVPSGGKQFAIGGEGESSGLLGWSEKALHSLAGSKVKQVDGAVGTPRSQGLAVGGKSDCPRSLVLGKGEFSERSTGAHFPDVKVAAVV